MLGIALLEAHSICNTGSLGSTSSRTDQILSVLDTGDFAAKPLCQEDGTPPLADSDIQDTLARC
jgi:hypothetical protein